eukprot:GHRQ01025352.1.p1 GENE.GHRQ01025352.1~~GHRQ01025352.1.p1  ORF type:complete len:119 (-),score=47.40 GHRQ01025352.1:254-610(-)
MRSLTGLIAASVWVQGTCSWLPATTAAAVAQQSLQELLVHRTWDPAAHPKWLVFEVEGQLQIRPAQYDIAQHLLANPGAIMQLNMGEGKTRVILPMLALHWADGSRLVSGGVCLHAYA